MFNGNGASGEAGGAKRITSEDLKGGEISQQVFKDCITHPATILPLAGSAGVFIFSAFAFSLAVTPIGALIATALFAAGGGNFVYNYFYKGEEKGIALQQQLMAQWRQQFVNDLEQLQHECSADGFSEGAQSARQLLGTYRSLQESLHANSSAALGTFRSLAQETLKQGLETLTTAHNLFKAIGSIDQTKLTGDLELARWQLAQDKTKSAFYQTNVKLRETQLERLKEKKVMLDELLAKAMQIDSALQTTQLELVELGTDDPTQFLSKDGGAMQRLNDTVSAARKVEADLRGHSDDDAALRSKYLTETATGSNKKI